MKKSYIFVGVFIILAFVVGVLFASNTKLTNTFNVELVNQYSKPLTFKVTQGNKFLPDLPETFILNPNKSLITKFDKSQVVCDGSDKSHVYISAYVGENPGPGNSAFFSIKLVCPAAGDLKVSGYLGDNIAYSWEDGKNVKIIFQDPKPTKKVNT